MTTPDIALPLSVPTGIGAVLGGRVGKRKRILLVDTSQTKRDLRADVMRKRGIDVDCAADFLEARCWWRADLYNLVLINVAGEVENRDKFCADLRSANPPQRIAFFVGSPEYLSDVPDSDPLNTEMDADALHKEMVAALLVHSSETSSHQRWGILEACKRISSVRSMSEARARVVRETPRPSRWTDPIEQYSARETATPHPPLFAEVISAEAALAKAVLTKDVFAKEREEAL
jgi:CheY-like chemotaxis protein